MLLQRWETLVSSQLRALCCKSKGCYVVCAPRAAGEHEFRLRCDALVQSRLLLPVPCLQSIPGPRTARRASRAASAKRSGSDHVVRALFASHGFARAYRRMVAKMTLAACKTLANQGKTPSTRAACRGSNSDALHCLSRLITETVENSRRRAPPAVFYNSPFFLH